MKLLNLCAGANRPLSEEWVNLDRLHPVLPEGSPERFHLDAETNYWEFDVLSGPLPFGAGEFDGVLASHCAEHWDCQEAVRVMADCRRILKPGGIMLVSVPDASYFRRVYDRDTVENAVELFGEPIHLPDGEQTFFGYGLWNRWHKAILTEDALWAYFVRAGFEEPAKLFLRGRDGSDISWSIAYETSLHGHTKPLGRMVPLLNRIPFSLVMAGVKS